MWASEEQKFWSRQGESVLSDGEKRKQKKLEVDNAKGAWTGRETQLEPYKTKQTFGMTWRKILMLNLSWASRYTLAIYTAISLGSQHPRFFSP